MKHMSNCQKHKHDQRQQRILLLPSGRAKTCQEVVQHSTSELGVTKFDIGVCHAYVFSKNDHMFRYMLIWFSVVGSCSSPGRLLGGSWRLLGRLLAVMGWETPNTLIW